jgi:hypothetical protein
VAAEGIDGGGQFLSLGEFERRINDADGEADDARVVLRGVEGAADDVEGVSEALIKLKVEELLRSTTGPSSSRTRTEPGR